MYTWTSSGSKSASGVIFARPCRIHSIIVLSDGTNAATGTIQDNASAASGTVIAKIICAGSQRTQAFWSDIGIECSNGAYLTVAGTGAEVIVHYSAL